MTTSGFQEDMTNGIRNVISSKGIIAAADITRNIYKMSYEIYDKRIINGIPPSYQNAQDKFFWLLPLHAGAYQENICQEAISLAQKPTLYIFS